MNDNKVFCLESWIILFFNQNLYNYLRRVYKLFSLLTSAGATQKNVKGVTIDAAQVFEFNPKKD